MSDDRGQVTDDELLEWELEDAYIKLAAEPSYLTHPVWLEHQKKKPVARDTVEAEATATWEEIDAARKNVDESS